MTQARLPASIDADDAPSPGVTPTESRSMTKHASGKYGRSIGQKERKAGWPAPATAWCYLCNDSHSWEARCSRLAEHPVFMERPSGTPTGRQAA